jgi:hypothetical protein
MAKKPDFDLAAAHKYFSTECFNRTWDYIDKTTRTKSDEDTMLRLSFASLWHWTQREDCTDTNLSVGFWQVARVYALIGQADNARYYGELCLEAALKDGVQSYFRGTAYEALARAEMVAGNREKMQTYLNQAQHVVDSLSDPEEKKMLLSDLATIHL